MLPLVSGAPPLNPLTVEFSFPKDDPRWSDFVSIGLWFANTDVSGTPFGYTEVMVFSIHQERRKSIGQLQWQKGVNEGDQMHANRFLGTEMKKKEPY